MSLQAPMNYNPISQGPATIPMYNMGEQQRIQPQPVPWCNPRRTKIIVAIVILTILWITSVVVWSMAKTTVTRRYSYSYNA